MLYSLLTLEKENSSRSGCKVYYPFFSFSFFFISSGYVFELTTLVFDSSRLKFLHGCILLKKLYSNIVMYIILDDEFVRIFREESGEHAQVLFLSISK